MQTKPKAAPKATPKAAANTKPKPAPKAAAKPKASAADKAAQRKALAERIATERKTANDVFAQCDAAAVSVPVKTLAAFKRSYKRNVTAHAIGRKPSTRQAAALAVAAAAANVKLADNAKFPRNFTMRGAAYAIENGALSDCIASGLASYDAKTETITLHNAAEIASLLGAVNVKI